MVSDILAEVDDDNVFWLANGKPVSSLKQLYELLRKMDDKIFSCHVNEEKNDFYNWVKDVFNDKKLADDLLWCTNKESMIFCLKSRLEEAERASLFSLLPSIDVQQPRSKKPDKKQTTASLAVMIDLEQIRRTASEKLSKSKKSSLKNEKETFNKLQVKKIRKEDNHINTIERVKEVYGL